LLTSEEVVEDRIGGTVHVFRGCIQHVIHSAFCRNGGVPIVPSLASRGAMFLESPSCATSLNSSLFEENEADLDGGALQACLLAFFVADG
jgi:hypothetical protein